MFTDADLSAPIEEADGLFAAIAAGADIAIGSRWLERTPPDHSPAALPPVLRPLFQRRHPRRHGPPLRRHAMRLQGLHPRRRANHLPAPDHRALGLRSRDSLHRPQARLSHRRSPCQLGPRRAHPHQLPPRRNQDACRTSPSSAGTLSSAATTSLSSASTAPISSSSGVSPERLDRIRKKESIYPRKKLACVRALCVSHLSKNRRPLCAGRLRHIPRKVMPCLPRQQRKCRRLLGLNRHAKIPAGRRACNRAAQVSRRASPSVSCCCAPPPETMKSTPLPLIPR